MRLRFTLLFCNLFFAFHPVFSQTEELNVDTSFIRSLMSTGKSLLQEGKPDIAKDTLQRAADLLWESGLEKGQLHAILYNYLGGCLHDLGEYQPAIDTFYRGIALFEDPNARDADLAHLFNNLAVVYNDMQKPDSAIFYLERCLEIRLVLYPEKSSLVLANIRNLAEAYLNRADYPKALSYYQKCLIGDQPSTREDSIGLSQTCSGISRVYLGLGQFKNALYYADSSIFWRELVLGKDHPELISLYGNRGVIHSDMGNYEASLADYHRGIELTKRHLREDHPNVFKFYLNIGNILLYQSRHSEAIDIFLKSEEIAEKIFGPSHYYLTIVWNNIGSAYQRIEEYEQALDYQRRVFDTRVSLFEELHPSVANACNNLGGTYMGQGNLDRALEFLKKGLEIRQRIFPSDHPSLGSSFDNLGICYQMKGNYVKAVDYYHKSLAILQQALGPEHPDLATPMSNLAVVYDLMGEFDLSIAFSRQKLDILKKHFGTDHKDFGIELNNMGNTFLRAGQTDSTLVYLEHALDFFRNKEGFKSTLARTLNNIGLAYLEKGEPGKAIEYLQEGLAIRSAIQPLTPDNLASSYRSLARAKLQESNFEEALKWLSKAKETLELSRDTLLANASPLEGFFTFRDLGRLQAIWGRKTGAIQLQIEAKTSFQDAFSFIFNHRNEVWLPQRAMKQIGEWAIMNSLDLLRKDPGKENSFDLLFQIPEKTRAIVLYQAMQEADALHFAGIPDSLLQKEYDLKVTVTNLEKKRQKVLSAGVGEMDAGVLDLNSRLFDQKEKYRDLIRQFESDFPEYYQLKYSINTISVKEIQSKVLDEDEALIEYFTGDSTLFIFLIKKDDFQVQEIPLDFPLQAWMQQLRDNISQPHPFNLELYAEVAHKLYEKLFAPLPDDLPEKLIIIPDGLLGYLPFEALLTEPATNVYAAGGLPYLLHKHQITYCYSATLLQQMQQKTHREEPTRELLAMAPYAEIDSVLTSHLFQGDLLASLVRSDTLHALPGTRAELDSLQRIFPTDAFYGNEATEGRFLDRAGSYRMLHLSTHGVADARTGDYSYLAFYPLADSLENELLFVRELYNLSLNADLVVLSACETASGELRRGEGIISLARAFAYAGAKSIATTLWKVNDQSMQALMVGFYRYLREGLPKDAALRQAKLDYLKANSGMQAGPYHWAPIIFVGDNKAIN